MEDINFFEAMEAIGITPIVLDEPKPNTTWIVAVYDCIMAYGGSEEGGWWYDRGSLTRQVRQFRSEARACAYCRKLNARLNSRTIGPNAGRREYSSAASDGEYRAMVWEDKCPAGFPDRRPRYE